MNASTGTPPGIAFRTLLVAALALSAPTPAWTHPTPGRSGTLNVVDSGAFIVLSVPVSAFDDVDDDGSGTLSAAELERHHDELGNAVVERVRLLDDGRARPLQGLTLLPYPPHRDSSGGAEHLIVTGRFALPETPGSLRLAVELFGTAETERTLPVTVTHEGTDRKRTLLLTPERPEEAVFPSSWSNFAALGALPVPAGPDYLLLLLVVLAIGWRARPIVRRGRRPPGNGEILSPSRSGITGGKRD